MTWEEQYWRNDAAYRRLKESIDSEYPKGWFVLIADEKVVGAAESFHAIQQTIRDQGRDPLYVFVVEAGKDYPGYRTLFSPLFRARVPEDRP